MPGYWDSQRRDNSHWHCLAAHKVQERRGSERISDIQKLVESLGFGVHLYADDTQFHGSCAVSEAAGLAGRAVRVVNEIKNWMSSNRLRLNADKT